MAVFHCTHKLAQKLSGVSAALIAETGTLGSWHGHLVRFERLLCVLFCHDDTRYCLFQPRLSAPQFADLGRWHRDLFLASLATEGIAGAVIARVDEVLGAPRFDTKTDRSVLASMNIALGDLAAHAADVAHILELDPLRASQQLNRRPARANGKWLRPERAMRERVARLEANLGHGMVGP